ncbi:hypothetical protein MLD38_000750 [Melastoma candidum]|uniref:Uncharacterized protein n=1 Tax=Melastoma candidum TaxID=119954 RepID=A0ACB9SB64_9MYRT|nr:hypothetical protein MLD38_000750 [Melastoma candidum]
MERYSRRDSDDVLLDFHDVFGGPPRRASMQEWRHSISGDRGELKAEAACRVDPWKAQGEKPVFGREGHAVGSTSRRRLNVGEDFFNDIFGGSDSGGSAHGGHDSDLFTVSPRSCVLSPVKPLPEALGNSGVLAQFSLPAKVSRPMDSPLGGAFNRSSCVHSSKAASFRYQGTTTVQEDMKKGNWPFYSLSPLSPNFAHENKESLSPGKVRDNEGEKEHAKKPQGVVDSSHFHFSIYRWASKGVPIAMPLRRANSTRMREKASTMSLYSDEHCVKEDNFVPSSTETAVPVDPPSGVEHDLPDNDLTEKSSSPNETGLQNVGEVTLASEESEILSASVPNNSADKALPDAQQRQTLQQHFSQDVDMEPEEPSKRNHEDNDQKIGGRHRKLRNSEPPSASENAADVKKTQEDGSNRLNEEQVNKVSVKGLGTNVGGDRSSERVRGKVKEYIHIFSQDNVPKEKPDVRKQKESIREKDRVTPNERKPIHTVSKLDNLCQDHTFLKVRDNGNAASNGEENNSSKNLFSDASSEQKSSSESSAEFASDEIRATVIEVEESFDENFMIKEMGKDETKGREPFDGREEFRAIDEKIRRWSRGKEGNIRSLLSTLQYVLWPNSGWRPVPLVDIIEGPAVKRAYQKALLCLHPDKLQQKGAASHQKHTAQQVYEILQEAWGHFSSLGVL